MTEATMTTQTQPHGHRLTAAPERAIVKIQKLGPNRFSVFGRGRTGMTYRSRRGIKNAALLAALDRDGKAYAFARVIRSSGAWRIEALAPAQPW
jgi:hypothetical protein